MIFYVEQISVMALADKVQTEGDAYAFMERLRWGDRPVCPNCHADTRISFLNPENGKSRKTRTGANSERRVWFCGHCRRQFSVLVGTVFQGTRISLRKWLFVIFEMCASKNGVSAREIQRKYNLTPKSAWFMLHRIREAMDAGPVADMFRGVVVADETYIGGKPKNRHQQGRTRPRTGKGLAGTPKDKAVVLTLVDKATGTARSRVIPDVTGPTLRKAMAEQIDFPNSVLHTDGHKPYRPIGKEMAGHEYVDHGSYEYVRGDVSTNQAENFFSQLKRSIDGTHHHVSKEHLHRYLAEFDFRYSTRTLSDSARMERLMAQVGGKRLTYSVSLAGV